ncbi:MULTISPECIES: hypothetical protein [Spiroplasma]|uniref:hypothetical protein n=1 Tax=Spiroplasma TaxID=2132 RepID=UPI0018DDDD7F|nr:MULTISPECIES: hypothetical protein [Spiroplasma]MBH8622807.1 hypothetical protein [Spiroplasma sp. hyd1]UNF61315.1 hypothetical protein MNU24_05210 [Spiroplasma poulsonii]
MNKTVKELIEENIDEETGWFNQEINYYHLLNNILQAHEESIKIYADIVQKVSYECKEKLEEKDKEIMELEKHCLCKYCYELHLHIKPIEKKDQKNGCKFKMELDSKGRMK